MGRGYRRAPRMMERQLNGKAGMLSSQPTLPNMYSNNGYGNSSGQSSFYPGDIVTPTSSNPFISPYAQDVQGSPVSSNFPDYHVSSHPTSLAVPAQAFSRSPTGTTQPTVIRQNSTPRGPHSPMVSSAYATDP